MAELELKRLMSITAPASVMPEGWGIGLDEQVYLSDYDSFLFRISNRGKDIGYHTLFTGNSFCQIIRTFTKKSMPEGLIGEHGACGEGVYMAFLTKDGFSGLVCNPSSSRLMDFPSYLMFAFIKETDDGPIDSINGVVGPTSFNGEKRGIKSDILLDVQFEVFGNKIIR